MSTPTAAQVKAALDYKGRQRAAGYKLFEEADTIEEALEAAGRAIVNQHEPTVRIDSVHRGFFVWTL